MFVFMNSFLSWWLLLVTTTDPRIVQIHSGNFWHSIGKRRRKKNKSSLSVLYVDTKRLFQFSSKWIFTARRHLIFFCRVVLTWWFLFLFLFFFLTISFGSVWYMSGVKIAQQNGFKYTCTSNRCGISRLKWKKNTTFSYKKP